MFIQKIKIIVPDEVIELVYCEKNGDYIKFFNNDLEKLNRKIIIYKTFDIHCLQHNIFELQLTHTDFDWKTFNIEITPPNDYIHKIQYTLEYNKEFKDFEFIEKN